MDLVLCIKMVIRKQDELVKALPGLLRQQPGLEGVDFTWTALARELGCDVRDLGKVRRGKRTFSKTSLALFIRRRLRQALGELPPEIELFFTELLSGKVHERESRYITFDANLPHKEKLLDKLKGDLDAAGVPYTVSPVPPGSGRSRRGTTWEDLAARGRRRS